MEKIKNNIILIIKILMFILSMILIIDFFNRVIKRNKIIENDTEINDKEVDEIAKRILEDNKQAFQTLAKL